MQLRSLWAPKQLAWAHKIRDEIAIIDPENEALQMETEAKYWIENRKGLLPKSDIQVELPELIGEGDELNKAQAIRKRFFKTFPGSELFKEVVEASFWLEHSKVIYYAVLGYELNATFYVNKAKWE